MLNTQLPELLDRYKQTKDIKDVHKFIKEGSREVNVERRSEVDYCMKIDNKFMRKAMRKGIAFGFETNYNRNHQLEKLKLKLKNKLKDKKDGLNIT